MNQFEITGGARIGKANVTYPFAKLAVTGSQINLKASIIGTFSFTPAEIISIESYHQIPIIGQGIKINHRVSDYEQKVIFWTFKNPEIVIENIRKTGFLAKINSEMSPEDLAMRAQHQKGGFPIKKPIAIGMIAGWNILFLFDFYKILSGTNGPSLLGNGAKIALGLLLMTALLTLFIRPFRKLILKEEIIFENVKRFFYFVILMSSFMLLILILADNSL